PIFSWSDDDGHQVTRAVLSFEAGAFIVDEKSIYHVRDALITDCLGGFDVSFATGGVSGSIAEAAQGERDSKRKRGSIVALVEPYSRAPVVRDMITAYGRW